MKYFYLFFIVFAFAACSKDKTYGPWKLKEGQQVEVKVSNQYGSIDDRVFMLPKNEPAQLSLSGFAEREPGYDYRVIARMKVDEGIQDGPQYYLEFVKVVSKTKYKENEPFKIALIDNPVVGGPVIVLDKKDGHYFSLWDKVELICTTDEQRAQLEEIWQNALYIHEHWQTPGIQREIKWKSVTVTVTHDPDNVGKAYRVQHIEMVE